APPRRRAGSRKRGRGVRFGLYACGWDLVTLPLGLFVVALADGPTAAGRALRAAVTQPARPRSRPPPPRRAPTSAAPTRWPRRAPAPPRATPAASPRHSA